MRDLANKARDALWIHNRTKDESEESTVQVGIVVDVVGRLAALVPGVTYVEKAKEETGHANGDEEQIDLFQRQEKDERKDHGSYTSGGTQ